MDRILFGDNQFFGVNHMSEEKARAQAMRFRDTPSIMRVLDSAYDQGIKVFMCTTHDRVGEVADLVRASPQRYPDFQFYPCMPYAHKYANSVGEVGMLETIKRFAPGGLVETLWKGATAAISKDVFKLMELLVDSEMKRFAGTRTPVVFVQNVVTDLLLGLGMQEVLAGFDRHVRERYGSEAGFITMNLPLCVERLEQVGVKNPIVCANINKIGFRMSGGVARYAEVLKQRRCRAIAMSVLASGAIPPQEAVEWVCGLEGVESIVFGASSAANIRQTRELIERCWGIAPAAPRAVGVGSVSAIEKRPRVRLLNVDVDDLTMDELVGSFKEGMLLTLHVDMIMKLQRDQEFYELLPEFDVVTCDSQILYFASKILGTPLRERVSGSDYWPLFCERFKADPSVTVFICGGAPGVAEIAMKNTNARVGRQMVVGVDAPPKDYEERPGEIDRMIGRINDSGATALMVGLGAGRQEKFIARNRHRFPGVRTFLPLGGTIDYEAGKLARPAPWITDAGLEWLYRLVREPRQRWHRYLVHQPPVLWRLLQQRLGVYRNPFTDRPQVRPEAPRSKAG